MHFLPDVYVPCEVCKGASLQQRDAARYQYKGKSISDVLEMTVDEGCEFFEPVPAIARRLNTLRDVGLGYVRLGQPATTLSGGEAQRVKLASELGETGYGQDRLHPGRATTGLHFADVERLLQILHRLVDAGNTVIVIEHNLDVHPILRPPHRPRTRGGGNGGGDRRYRNSGRGCPRRSLPHRALSPRDDARGSRSELGLIHDGCLAVLVSNVLYGRNKTI